jgi:Rrf2 family protein
MAGRKTMVSAAELVKELNIPRPFLRRILQRLGRKKVLKSFKGNKGGFELAVPAGAISLIDVMRVFQGRFGLNECFFKRLECPNRRTCVLRKQVLDIERYAEGKLRDVTIEILAIGTLEG